MTIGGVNDLIIGAVNNYKIEGSLRFSRERQTYLTRKNSATGNRKTFTFATWLKRGSTYPAAFSIFDYGKWDPSVASQSNIRIQGGTYDAQQGAIEIYDWNTTFVWRVTAIQNLLLDTSAWYHVLIAVDTTQTVASNRVKIYVNGILQTQFAYANYPSLNADTYFNSEAASDRFIGATNNLTEFFDGYLADTYFIDGQALTPGAFGLMTDDGTFVPRKYTGDVGINGFFLDYKTTANVTNKAAYTENFIFNPSGWSIQGTTSRIANSGIAPNGANTATKLIQSTPDFGTTQHYIWRTNSNTFFSNNTQYTVSFYAKAQETKVLQSFIPSQHAGGTALTVNYDLENGVVQILSGNANTSANIQHVGNNWYRVSKTFISSPAITTSGQIQLKLLDSANNNNYVGDGVSGALIWGYQVNPGPTPDPYLFTYSGSQANTDGVNITGYGFGVDKSSTGLNTYLPVNLQISSNTFISDITFDSPTDYSDGSIYGRGNYCQFNINDTNEISFVGCAATRIGGSANSNIGVGTIAVPTSGKWYFEVMAANTPGANAGINIGFVDAQASGTTPLITTYTYPRLLYINNGTRIHTGGMSGANASGLATFGNNDVIGVALDRATGNTTFYKNNVAVTSINVTLLTSLPVKPYVETYSGTQAYVNFGATPFRYTPPTDYKPLNTINMPTPPITRPKRFFEVKTWAGDGTTSRDISGFEFAPNLTIIKNRTANNWWNVYDTQRGPGAGLFLNSPFILGNSKGNEVSNNVAGYLSAFNPNSITLERASTGIDVNASGNGYIAYTWNENISSGLDIVSWSGNGVNNRSIAHNLGVRPGLIIVKNRSSFTPTAWRIWVNGMANNHNLQFNNTNYFDTPVNTTDGGIGSANSTVFTLVAGTTNMLAVNENDGSNYIGYVFSAVSGYSQFGLYQCTGDLNGPFIYTGFKPALVMIKAASIGSTANWVAFNSVSDRNAVEGKYELYPNTDYPEAGTGTDIWTYANGFKVTDWTEVNAPAPGAYAYAAWADIPFKFARGR